MSNISNVKPTGHNSSGGRNNTGRITIFHRGGGHKQRYRWVNYVYPKSNTSNDVKVVGSIYDPLRSGKVGIIESNGVKKYELISEEMSKSSNLEGVRGVELSTLSSHTPIFNVELQPGKGGQLVRSAGCFATVVNHVNNYTRIRLPSGEQRLILSKCKCNIGSVGGISEKDKSLKLHHEGKGKAGRSRWRGIRPTVRGTAMNPIDHPHGGGQGKTSGGRPSVTPWSLPKGVRTSSGRGSSYIIVSRRTALTT